MTWSPSERRLTGDEAGLDRQLLDGPVDGLAGQHRVRVRQLEEDATGLHDRDPALRVALAGAHAGLGGLLGDGLVGEHGDPHLAATTGLAGHGDTGGLDLAGGDPTRLESLDPVLAEGDLAATLGLTLHATALLLAVLDLLGHQHLRSEEHTSELTSLMRLSYAVFGLKT